MNRPESPTTVPPPWPHQQATTERALSNCILFDTSDPGCVSGETEFLTPTGWKRIDAYEPHDLVAQVNPSTLDMTFAEPLAYVNKQCSAMYWINPARGLSMQLSPEHRVLYYSSQRDLSLWRVCSAAEYVESPRNKLIASTFNPPEAIGLSISDESLRLVVAVIADGHFPPYEDSRCIVRLKREDKQQRLRALLHEANVEFDERQCGGADPGFQVFTFHSPFRDKHFDEKYWTCSRHQLEIIADECMRWDGTAVKGNFYSRDKRSADFIQYVFTSLGYPTSLSTYTREGGVDYVVHRRSNQQPFVGKVRPESISRFRPKDGRKYCFTTQTSFWVARHNGRVFITGNTGKTRAHIDAFAEHHRQGLSSRCLVVCPKTLMGPAWAQDIHTFQPDLRVALAYAENRRAMSWDADVIVVNVDGVKFFDKMKPTQLRAIFPEDSTLIVDEVTAFKNHASQRSKAMAKLSKLFKYRRILTGTPNPNSVIELWHPMLILDGGERLGNRFYQFRSNVQEPREERGFTRWTDKPEALDVVSYLIKDVTIRHEFDAVMDVPAVSHRYVHFDVNKRLFKAYQNSMSSNTVAIKDYIDRDILPANAAVMLNKMLQLLSGAVYDEHGGYELLDRSRYELITDLVEERDHSIVFISWEHQLKELSTQLTKRGITHALLTSDCSSVRRDELVADYQRGAYQTLLMHPKTGAHGLTLTRGRSVIWASPRYEADYFKQGIARVRRGTQSHKTQNIMLCANDTIEQDVYRKLVAKIGKMDGLLKTLAA